MDSGYFDKTPNGVIVLGGHVQGLGIVRIFGENKILCIVLDSVSSNLARHSKYCLNFFVYPEHHLLDYLLNFSNNSKYKNWLLIPTNDYQVEILSKNKKILENHFKVSIADWDIIEKCHNKRLTYQLAADCGIDFPITLMPNSIDELKCNKIEYPCIIKPAVMYTFYKKTRKKVYKCHNENELIDNYKKAIEVIPADEIIVQEIIPGDSENQYSTCFLYDGNSSLVSIAAKRKRQHPIEFGNATTFAETVHNPIIINQAKKILNKIGFRGLCEVEFKYDSRDGKYKFLEINPRTWKWHYISKASGSPFLMGLYNFLYFGKEVIKNKWPIVRWQHISTDYAIQFQYFLRNKKLINRDSGHPDIFAVFSLEDIKPFLFELIYLPIFLLKR